MVAATSGCHRKPRSLTPIPGVWGPSATDTTSQNNVPPSAPLNPEPGVTSNPTGTPESYGKWGGLLNGPHNEDTTKFAADIVYFDFDQATVKASEEDKLKAVADYFKNNNTDALIITGNCDERGTEKYNLSLGERRALASREYLGNLGIDVQRIKTVSYGASKPAAEGHDESAWKQNRRDEFILVTPK